MWQHILALPLVAKAIPLLGVVGLAVWGWFKHQAISKAGSAATKTAESKVWVWMAKKVYAAVPPPTAVTTKPHNEKTYRGTFLRYAQHATYPRNHFFEIEHEGTTHTVPVMGTHLLKGLQPGVFVEIDTLLGVTYYVEVVQRVRVLKEKPKPRGPFASGPGGY
jgi:hypothetical protein